MSRAEIQIEYKKFVLVHEPDIFPIQ